MQPTGFCIFCHYASKRGACAHAVATIGAADMDDDADAAPPATAATSDGTVIGIGKAVPEFEDAAAH